MTSGFVKPDEEFHPLRILLWGADGTAKTPTALYFSKKFGPAAAIDADGGLQVYPASRHNYRLLRTQDPVLVRDQLERLLQNPAVPGEDERFRLFILDPITTVYNRCVRLVEEAERRRSREDRSEFLSALNKGSWGPIKRLYRDITQIIPQLGMPSIVTAREGNLWENERITGKKPDCDKDLPHEFDVVIHMEKLTSSGPRVATVDRDRFCKLEPRYEAPLDDVFWLAKVLEEAFPEAWGIEPIAHERATQDQVDRIRLLVKQGGWTYRGLMRSLSRYGVDTVEELSPVDAGDVIAKLELKLAEQAQSHVVEGDAPVTPATVGT